MKDPIFKVKEGKVADTYGEFTIEPLETGFGHTVGNALRRILLTAIPGAAITHVRIAGVRHKFSTIPGVKENVLDLLLNLKELNVRLLDSKQSVAVTLSAKGPKEVTAQDIEVTEDVVFVDKKQYICSLADKKSKVEMELTIEKGYGYELSEDQRATTLGVIPTDAIFTPVRRVNYSVEATRVGRQTNFDRLNLYIWTNGAVKPREALDEAAKVIASYFLQIYEPKASLPAEGVAISQSVSEDILKLTIDELDLPTRIFNSLRNSDIETIGQLLGKPRKDLMSMRNMGAKSIAVIEGKLREKGISLTV